MSGTVVVRRISATPARSAAETWDFIVRLLANDGRSARSELDRAGGVAMAMIAAEAPRHSPIVVSGVGSRLRVYCLYDEDAILETEASEDRLSRCPTDGDWKVSLPCPVDDIAWASAALANSSSRITVRDMAEAAPEESESAERNGLGPIDVEAFLRR